MEKNTIKLLNCLEESLNAVKNKDAKKIVELKSELNTLIDIMINENESHSNILDEYPCFGVIHKVFEHNAPVLFKTNNGKKIIRRYINTIKNDNVLKEEFSFYEQIMSSNDKNVKSNIIDDALSIKNNFNKDKIDESNKKLIDLIKENCLDTNINIDKNLLNVLTSIDNLYKTKKSIKNLSKIAESKKNICDYEGSINKQVNKSLNIDDVVSESIDSFNEKYKDELNENEKNVISIICNANSLNEKEELFNECKNDLINEISSIIDENTTTNDIKEKLKILKEKVSLKSFNEKTLVNDMIEFYDISDILE